MSLFSRLLCLLCCVLMVITIGCRETSQPEKAEVEIYTPAHIKILLPPEFRITYVSAEHVEAEAGDKRTLSIIRYKDGSVIDNNLRTKDSADTSVTDLHVNGISFKLSEQGTAFCAAAPDCHVFLAGDGPWTHAQILDLVNAILVIKKPVASGPV